MKLTRQQFKKIAPTLPVQRGNVEVDNYTFLNAVLHVLENGCKWRALPERFGKWATVYKRFRRWSENGVLLRTLQVIQAERFTNVDLSVLSLDSTFVKASPSAAGALKKTANNLSVEPKAESVRK